MTLLKGGEEIVRGITGKTSPGHTANMQAVIVDGRPGKNTTGKGTAPAVPHDTGFERARLPAAPSESEKGTGALAPATACYISDLIPTTPPLALTWCLGVDLFPLRAI